MARDPGVVRFFVGFLKKTNDWSDRDMPSWDSWATNRDSWATKEIRTVS